MRKLIANSFLSGPNEAELGFDGTLFLNKFYEGGGERRMLPSNWSEPGILSKLHYPIGTRAIATHSEHARVGGMELCGMKRFASTMGITANSTYFTYRGSIYRSTGEVLFDLDIDGGSYTSLRTSVSGGRDNVYLSEILFEDNDYFFIQVWTPSNALGEMSTVSSYAGDSGLWRVHKESGSVYGMFTGNIRCTYLGRTADFTDTEGVTTYGIDYLLVDFKSSRYASSNNILDVPMYKNSEGEDVPEAYRSGGNNLYLVKLVNNYDISDTNPKPFEFIYLGSTGFGWSDDYKLCGQYNIAYDHSIVDKDGNGKINGFYYTLDATSLDINGSGSVTDDLELHYYDLNTLTSGKVTNIPMPKEYKEAVWDTGTTYLYYAPHFRVTGKMWMDPVNGLHVMLTSSGFEAIKSLDDNVTYPNLPVKVLKFNGNTFEEVLSIDNIHVGACLSEPEQSKHMLFPFYGSGTEVVAFDTTSLEVQHIDLESQWTGAAVAEGNYMILAGRDSYVLRGEVESSPVEINFVQIEDFQGSTQYRIDITGTEDPIDIKITYLSGNGTSDIMEGVTDGATIIFSGEDRGTINFAYEVL